MFDSKRLTAMLTALVSAGVLAAAPASTVYAADSAQDTETEEEEVHFKLDPEEFADPADYEEAYLKIVTQFGDVNYDHVVGIADAVQLQRFLLGEITELGNWKNADLNENGAIDAVDFTMLKQQITGQKRTGGTMAVGVVDMMTGESVPGVSVNLFVCCDEYGYNLGEWVSKENETVYFSGLPTDDKYTYYLDCSNLPEGYGNEFGNWDQQMTFKFDDKTDLAVNARLISQDTERNIHFKAYDWATDMNVADYDFFQYGRFDVRDKNGVQVYGLTPISTLALPDGEYHVDVMMHNCPLRLLDPESDYADYLKTLNPDLEFTDKRNGIDFTVKDGKLVEDVTFDLSPLEDKSNSITVNCINGTTGEPLEGVEISLIEAPKSYAKTVQTWTSDSTGKHTFEGLMRAGYLDGPAYEVRVDKVPAGYVGGYDQDCCFGYVYDYNYEFNYLFGEDTTPKLVSANIINFSDKSEMNDLATYDVYRTDPDDVIHTDIVYTNVKAGEKISLPDGEYFAALNGRECCKNGYESINLLSRKGDQLKKFFNQEDYLANAGYIVFKVKDNKPDKDLTFYVMECDTDKDAYFTEEEMEKFEALWGTEETE